MRPFVCIGSQNQNNWFTDRNFAIKEYFDLKQRFRRPSVTAIINFILNIKPTWKIIVWLSGSNLLFYWCKHNFRKLRSDESLVTLFYFVLIYIIITMIYYDYESNERSFDYTPQ